MRTLALHTLSSHTARYTTVRTRQTRETADRPALTHAHLRPFQTLSIDTRRISSTPHRTQTAWHIIHGHQTVLQYTEHREHIP